MKRFLTGFIFSLFFCVFLAEPVRAQTPEPNPGGYEPLQSCMPNINSGEVTIPPPYCPLGGSVNTVPFVAPDGHGTWEYNSAAPDCAIWASAIGDSGSWINAVCNRTYRDGDYIIQKSQDKHLTYQITGGAIMFLEDTTWANGETCQETGSRAMQRMTNIKFVDTNLTCITDDTSEASGVTRSSGSNAAYNYEPPGHEQFTLSPATACTNNHAGSIGAGNKLVYYGPGRCGDWSGNIITLANLPGTAGAGEVTFFCEGVGLCAWYQHIDWSTTSPSQWTAATDVCAGFGMTPKGCYVDKYVVNEPMELALIDRLKLSIQESLLGRALNLNFDIGVLDPQDDYNTDDLTPQAHWLRDVFKITSHADVKPRIDEDKISHKSSLQSVICYTDPATNESKRIESKTPIIVGGHPWMAKLEDGVEGLSTYIARTEKPLEDGRYKFNDDFDEILGAHPECPERNSGAQPPVMVLPAVGVNSYTGTGGSSSQSIIEVIGMQITDAILSLFRNSPFLLTADLIPAQHMSNVWREHEQMKEFSHAKLAKEFQDKAVESNGQQTNRFLKPDGREDVKGTRNEFTYEDRINAICVECSVIPYDIQVKRRITGPDYCGACKADLPALQQPQPTLTPRKPPIPSELSQCSTEMAGKLQTTSPEGGGDGGPPGSLSGFTIAYRDPSCALPADSGPKIADLAVRWLAATGATEQFIRKNVEENWMKVQDAAIANNWNPAFVIMLWIEESAAGGAQTWQMGCLWGWDTSGEAVKMSQDADACSEAYCLFSHPVAPPDDLQKFMCSYNTGVCKTLSPGDSWGFANNIRFAYPLVARDIGNLPAHCQLRE